MGGLPVGYVYVSKPRRARKNQDKKASSKEGKGEKPKVRKTTPDKYLFGHPHADAVPYDSVTKFVKHAFWLIHGRCRNPWTGYEHDSQYACECSVCSDAYDILSSDRE